MWTPFFINSSTREKRFSHVGIVAGIDGESVIIHADADDRTGVGIVHTEGWRSFLKNALECAVYRYDGAPSVATNIAENARMRLGVPFGSAFDMSETNKLYCSEMVRLAINEAVGTNLVGYSYCYRKLKIVAIDDLYYRGFNKVFDSKWSVSSSIGTEN